MGKRGCFLEEVIFSWDWKDEETEVGVRKRILGKGNCRWNDFMVGGSMVFLWNGKRLVWFRVWGTRSR